VGELLEQALERPEGAALELVNALDELLHAGTSAKRKGREVPLLGTSRPLSGERCRPARRVCSVRHFTRW
jgi:hypothetical protein